ncbi:MAG: membrane protein insertase YidC, partial [Saprospiraceae bacterium]
TLPLSSRELWRAPMRSIGQPDSLQNQTGASAPAPVAPAANPTVADSATRLMLAARFGAFAPAGAGTEQIEVLENDLLRVKFSSKGGRITEVWLKKFEKINTVDGVDAKSPVYLLEDAKNKFEYQIPVATAAGGVVNSSDLYFTASKSGNSVTFRADAGEGRYLEQTYTLAADNYQLDYKVGGNGLNAVLTPGQNFLRLNWLNHLDKLEKNQQYERTMSSVYYKPTDKSADYCDCRSDDSDNLGEKPVQWFSHSNQFFNTSVVANNFSFREFVGETKMLADTDGDLKILASRAIVPLDGGTASMTIYTGPNEFDRLRAYKVSLEDIIPFGSSIFGSINRWVIHPIFDFLLAFISSKGLVIILLTLLVKLLVYPLTYRMVLSQSKMAALKPQIDIIRKKHGDDQQAVSLETMKLYNEWGVNPLGGCFPIFLQMPIWFALYRFFPAAIEFRQASFLWATDLSSYDVFFKLPFFIPAFGDHVSLFTLLWVVTTLWYTWYSMKQMDSSMMNPAMKYMQYFMPVMFLFFFNNFASGLTCYLVFSNILNIGQTVVTKKYLIDNEKIMAKLEANKAKPKKTSGWRAKFEDAMKEAQKQQAEKQKQGKKK